jgi:hypothetical protein
LIVANAVAEADKFGVFLRFDGDRLALKGSTRPSDELLAKAQTNKRFTITILRRKAGGRRVRSTAGRSPATGYAQTRASCHIGYRG